ncbi:MAG: zf-HC2 domain-containing protein [Acidimicrobiia bacterium]|nr:zf-HC2 domain-containing protein [Acidimicrobiia bacterium]
MTHTDWHAPPELLTRYADAPATIDDMTASSIEAHLVACAECRRHLSATADPALAVVSWSAIAERIDQPHPTPVERLLGWVGIESGLARVVAATPGLQAAGVATVVLLAAAAALASRSAGAVGPFLLVAPLAPLAAVAVAFAPAADPAGEAGIATPLHGAGLMVRRAAAVLAVTFTTLGLTALALPDLGPRAAAWVLPGLALALGALALSTWLRVEVAVSALAAAWLTAVWSLYWAAGHAGPVADSATFTAVGQVTSLAVAAVAAALIVVRRDRFATPEGF